MPNGVYSTLMPVFFNDFYDPKSKNLRNKKPMQQKRKTQKPKNQHLVLKFFDCLHPCSGYNSSKADKSMVAEKDQVIVLSQRIILGLT